MKTVAHVRITPGETVLNGNVISRSGLTELYRELRISYPKFFKMDSLCKLGFLASELLLKDTTPESRENAAIALFNRNSSLITDRNYCATIKDDNYFPSPALFVYTLPNIITGEIAIRNKIYGETSFYIKDAYDPTYADSIVNDIFQTSSPEFVLTGWVDYDDETSYLADMKIIKKQQDMENLIPQLKDQIISALNLEDMTADDIDANAPLFGEGLGLDSIDALELIVLLEREYGIKLTNPAEGKEIFKSVATLADYVSKNRKK